MMSLNSKIALIGTSLVEGLTENGELTVDVYHYWRPNMSAPFVVWAEEEEESSHNADDLKQEQAVTGYIDFYTKTEYDSTIDTIQNILNTILGAGTFSWRLNSVQYEDETNLIHYEWRWSVA